jgi:hypothetical protein
MGEPNTEGRAEPDSNPAADDGRSRVAGDSSPTDETLEPPSDEADPRLGRWRVVFPTISVVIGMIGIGVHLGFAAQMLFPEVRERQFGFDLPDPPEIVRNWVVLQSVLLVLIGAMLVAGSALLLRRNPLGARLALAWSVVRLVLVAANIAVGAAAYERQVAWSKDLAKAMRDGRLEQGVEESALQPLPTDEATRNAFSRQLVVISIASATWPCVMAIVLTRRHVREEVRGWRRSD